MLILFIRTTILYIAVVSCVRLMGKRQLGELQPYELVITIMISDLAVSPMQDVRLPLLLGIIPIVTLLLIKTIINELELYSPFIEKIIDGSPVILIENGKINTKNLKNQKMTKTDLLEELRESGFFNAHMIKYAILETNGKISLFPYNSSKTKEDSWKKP